MQEVAEDVKSEARPLSGYKLRYGTSAARSKLAESAINVLGCGDHLIPILDMLAELDPIQRGCILRAALALNDGEILRRSESKCSP